MKQRSLKTKLLLLTMGLFIASGLAMTLMQSSSLNSLRNDIVSQTRQALENIKAVLEAAGSSLNEVVRCGVFLADMNDFGPMNEEYGSYFQGQPPARTTVQVARLPRNALVEIDCIAYI